MDDFKRDKIDHSKQYQDIDALNRLTQPSYLSVIKQIERAFEPLTRLQLEISHAREVSGIAAQTLEIANVNKHWKDSIKQTITTNLVSETLAAAHRSWAELVSPIKHDFLTLSQFQAISGLTLCDTSLRLSATARLLEGIDFKAIRSLFQVDQQVVLGLKNAMTQLTASYGSLAGSLRDVSDIIRLPIFVLPGATREIFTTSFALDTLRPWNEQNEEEVETENQLAAEVEQEISGCIALLQQVDPGLARPYVGARDALNSNNADKARHILSSLRELWNHLLRRLAPDDLVTSWIPRVKGQNDLLYEGKPTRRARLLYACRELNNGPLVDFLVHDTRALVKLIELFNRVHELETGLTDKQLRAILLKNDSWLMYILQVSTGNFQA